MIEELRTALGRRRWDRVEGRVIDKRHVKSIVVKYESTSQRVSIDEYMVEFLHADSTPHRLVVKRKSVHLPFRGVAVGDTVPLHVNRRATKAVFGHFEPVVSRKERQERERRRRSEDEARFERKLNEM